MDDLSFGRRRYIDPDGNAAYLLDGALDLGIARPRAGAGAAGYLERHLGSVAVPGPSLGAMESDNQHLYGARMDSVPCGWSAAGACDMGRLVSRRESGRPVPRLTREASATLRRRRRREARELRSLERAGPTASRVAQSVAAGTSRPTAHLWRAWRRASRSGPAWTRAWPSRVREPLPPINFTPSPIPQGLARRRGFFYNASREFCFRARWKSSLAVSAAADTSRPQARDPARECRLTR